MLLLPAQTDTGRSTGHVLPMLSTPGTIPSYHSTVGGAKVQHSSYIPQDLLLPDKPVSLSAPWSLSITYGSMFAVGGWVGMLLLIFLFVLMNLCFVLCCQAALHFRPHLLKHLGKSTQAHIMRTSSIFASFCAVAAAVTNAFDNWCLPD